MVDLEGVSKRRGRCEMMAGGGGGQKGRVSRGQLLCLFYGSLVI